jgi:hypothetical protein
MRATTIDVPHLHLRLNEFKEVSELRAQSLMWGLSESAGLQLGGVRALGADDRQHLVPGSHRTTESVDHARVRRPASTGWRMPCVTRRPALRSPSAAYSAARGLR